MEETQFGRGTPAIVLTSSISDGNINTVELPASAIEENDTHDAGVGYTYPFPLPTTRTRRMIIFAIIVTGVLAAAAILVVALWLNGNFGYGNHVNDGNVQPNIQNETASENLPGHLAAAVPTPSFWTPSPHIPVLRMHDITTPPTTIILPGISIYPHKFCTPAAPSQTDLILIAVITEPEDGALRADYRQIWNLYLPHIAGNLVFILANSHIPKLQKSIRREANESGDILQFNTPSSSTEKYLKTLATLQWADGYCPHRFMLRMNVDVLVQVESLRMVLENAMNKSLDQTPAILGDVIEQEGAVETSHFPKFVLGSFYIITRPAFRRIVDACKRVRPTSLEEVYLTGSCADAGNIARIKIEEAEMERELSLWRKMFSCLSVHVLSVSGVGKENVIHYWQKAVRAGCYL